MAQILNNIKSWWFEKRLANHDIKKDFHKKFLPIRSAAMQEKLDVQLNRLEFKKNKDLLPYQIKANVTSDFLQESFNHDVEILNEKYYWKQREAKQTIKREGISEEKQNQMLKALEDEKEVELSKIKASYFVSETSLSKADYDTKAKEIENIFKEKSTHLKTRYESKKSKFIEKTNAKIEFHTKKALALKKIVESYAVKKKKSILNEGELLKLDNLSMHFGGLKAVDQLSFTVKEGEIFGLIGPNGAGKTTVFNCITRFYKPTLGNVYFNNNMNETVNLNTQKVHNIIKHGIVRTFQNVEMIWELNVIENLLVAAHTQYRSGFFGHLFNTRLLKQEEVIMRSKATEILKDLGLIEFAYQYPMGLPYGILKKVELARTLMVNPKLIILDEPAAGLNDAETDQLAKTIKKIQQEYNTTIFLVEHDMGLVMEICDTVCAISFGKKLAIGTPKEIQSSKVVREAYLGGE